MAAGTAVFAAELANPARLRLQTHEVAPLYEGSNRVIEDITARLSAADTRAVIGALATMNDAFTAEAIRLRAEQHSRVPGRLAELTSR